MGIGFLLLIALAVLPIAIVIVHVTEKLEYKYNTNELVELIYTRISLATKREVIVVSDSDTVKLLNQHAENIVAFGFNSGKLYMVIRRNLTEDEQKQLLHEMLAFVDDDNLKVRCELEVLKMLKGE